VNNSTSTSAKIIGFGSYLPEKILTNHDISKLVDTNDEWIIERTGIKQRHIAAENEKTSDMAIAAAKNAIADAKISANEIDLIIVATTTPDNIFPSVAVAVQNALDCNPIPAFDVQAVCAGFVYGLSVAEAFILAKKARNALVIGADRVSSILDWTDRGTCILFGDGAGAVILQASDDLKNTSKILGTKLYSDGSKSDILHTPHNGFLQMHGQEVFKHAVTKLSKVTKDLLADCGITPAEIDWVIPHQANQRILTSVADRLTIPHNKLISTVEIHGNTSAASIPLALDIAHMDGRLRTGQLISIQAIGGGLTWGAALIRL